MIYKKKRHFVKNRTGFEYLISYKVWVFGPFDTCSNKTYIVPTIYVSWLLSEPCYSVQIQESGFYIRPPPWNKNKYSCYVFVDSGFPCCRRNVLRDSSCPWWTVEFSKFRSKFCLRVLSRKDLTNTSMVWRVQRLLLLFNIHILLRRQGPWRYRKVSVFLWQILSSEVGPKRGRSFSLCEV